MPSLSGTRLCPPRSNSQKVAIRPHPSLWWDYSVNIQDGNNTTSTSYNATTIRRRSADDALTPKALEAFHIPPRHYILSHLSRRTSTVTSCRLHNSGIVKRPVSTRPIASQPQISDVGNVDTNAAVSQVSSAESVVDTVGSCEQDSSSTGLSLLSDPNHGNSPPCILDNNIWPANSDANDEAAAQVSATPDAEVYQTNEASPNERIQHESEGDDDALDLHEDDDQTAAASSLSLYPDTEFQANLLAAPEDSRHLFLEYYERTHGNQVIEAESQSEVYWKWDQEKQKWFHKDANTESVVWFMG
ncbi:hypothetical protein F4859DRAFT_237223 [Xylaria cf. heliscus]|nr:hypothetical protein F4859DRAFT_237223 [Xylaria cf. heliscus]